MTKAKYDIQTLEDKGLILFSAIMGSRAYGTSLPTSDTDIRGVFIQPIEDILGYGKIDQVADELNDIVYYEVGKFLQLVATNNPNILELLNAPKDCILIQDPLFDLILEQKENFITKQCRNSFAGYAIQQIKKARGYNKKINWEENEMVRKTPLDFCYVLVNGQTIHVSEHIKSYNRRKELSITAEDVGLANIEHAHNMYAMYDLVDHDIHKGIVSKREANEVQLTSIPKNIPPFGHMYYNKDAYSLHCKKFNEYNEWLENRNEDRFKMNKDHGKNYDSKNMAHCVRLLDMAVEIADKKIIVRRPPEHIELLMSIRRGEMEFDDLLEMADLKLKLMDEVWDKSTLPKSIDRQLINDLLVKIRKLRYNLE